MSKGYIFRKLEKLYRGVCKLVRLYTKVCKILQTLQNYIFAILKNMTLKSDHSANFKVLFPAELMSFRYLL